MRAFIEKLIREIERLYQMAALAILHKRVGDYRLHVDHLESPHAGDIKSPLLNYIDSVVVSAKPAPKKTFTVDSFIPKQPEPDKYHYEKHHADARRVNNYKHVGDLSKYFKSRRKAYELQPGIKTKLEHSVWEHINAAIHSAHKGDSRSAKMHVDIANSAFKEVAHFIPEAEYAEFTKKVNERMNDLTSVH